MGLLDGILNTAGSVGSALIGSNAATKASNAQQRAVKQAQGALTSAYDQGTAYQKPAYDIGQQNLSTLNQMVNSGGFKTDPYGYKIQDPNFQFKTDPGYQFRLQQGQSQINNRAAAGGNQLSGATQKALQQYGQGFASNEYNNAFNRYNNQYQFGVNANMTNEMNRYNTQNQQNQNLYNQMTGLADLGVQGGNNLANYAQQYGNSMAGQYGNLGNAQAAGIMGRGQAWQTGLNNTMGGLTGSMYGSGYNGYGSQYQPSMASQQGGNNNQGLISSLRNLLGI